MANIEELRIVENINAKYGQVNAECLPVMTGYEARLEARMKLNKCLICCDNLARVREYLVINQLLYNAKTYAKTWHGFAGWLAYRLSSVASHHVGVVVCVWAVGGAGW